MADLEQSSGRFANSILILLPHILILLPLPRSFQTRQLREAPGGPQSRLRVLLLLSSTAFALSSASRQALWAGVNLPWNQFGYDIGGSAWNSTYFSTSFESIKSYGANSVRFWLHADGRSTPTFSEDGEVTGMGGPNFGSDLMQLVELAKAHELVLQLCLWSFDMCKGEDRHTDLISNVTKTDSYVKNALTPMLELLRGSKHVVIEAINEPEWCMKSFCEADECVEVSDMQRFTAKIAEAVHSLSTLRVTTGSASLKFSSAGRGEAAYWNDASLRTAFPSTVGVLDFYNVHYYDWMFDPKKVSSWDMCSESADWWGLDKPTVVAELPASSEHFSTEQMLECSSANGFAGNLFWAFNDPAFPLAPALPALENFTAARSEVTSFHALLMWLDHLPPVSSGSAAANEVVALESLTPAAARSLIEHNILV